MGVYKVVQGRCSRCWNGLGMVLQVLEWFLEWYWTGIPQPGMVVEWYWNGIRMVLEWYWNGAGSVLQVRKPLHKEAFTEM